MEFLKNLFKKDVSKTNKKLRIKSRKVLAFYRSVIRYQFSKSAYRYALEKSCEFTDEWIALNLMDADDSVNQKLQNFIKKVSKETRKMPYA
jgi:hypothetical protein